MHSNSKKTRLFLALATPWLIAALYSHHPLLSFLLSFAGSFYIFYITILSPWSFLDPDVALSKQVMKPIVLVQLIFAGLMCCTSIFYFADHIGFQYFNHVHNYQVTELTYLLAKCQRMTLLAHLALVMGLGLQIKIKPLKSYKLHISIDRLLFYISLSSILVIFILVQFPALNQFSLYLKMLSISAQMLLFIRGIYFKNLLYICYGSIALTILLLNATLTGYKETVLVYLITFSFLAFPYFKKAIGISFIPLLALLLYILPTFTTVMRKLSWTDHSAPQTARLIAYEALLNEDNEGLIKSNNWEFMTMRLSEISMFSQYLKTVPEQQPYYGMQILNNSLLALIPRAFWREKPDTEKMAMERVYRSGVVNRLSPVSAKTRTAIDGYLSAGLTGVFLSMLCYGLITQWLANKAETLFGGYQLGCTIIFNSIFQQLWRGNNWEFIINNMVYGTITMFLLFQLLIYFNILKPYDHDNHPAHHTGI